MKRLGISDLPGGYVLTGGVANMQGVLELAQDILQNRVRMAVPDYIGVREPQYTTGVGLIKYAYKNTRLPGGSTAVHASAILSQSEKRAPKQQQQLNQKLEKHPEEKMSSKVKKFLGYFFE